MSDKTKETTTEQTSKKKTRPKQRQEYDTQKIGNRTELKARRWFEQQGFSVLPCKASRGEFDFCALSDRRVVLCSVKTRNYSCSSDLLDMINFKCPEFVEKIEIRWQGRKSAPEVRIISEKLLESNRRPTNGNPLKIQKGKSKEQSSSIRSELTENSNEN